MKLTKKQIKAVYNYLVNIQQPTTAKQFKKDWSKKKSNTIPLRDWVVDEYHSHETTDPELKEKIRDLTEPKGTKGVLLIKGKYIKGCTLVINKEFELRSFYVRTPYVLGDEYYRGKVYNCKFITREETYSIKLFYVNPYGNELTGTGALIVEPKQLYHEEDQPGKENTISKPIDMDKINKIFNNLSE